MPKTLRRTCYPGRLWGSSCLGRRCFSCLAAHSGPSTPPLLSQRFWEDSHCMVAVETQLKSEPSELDVFPFHGTVWRTTWEPYLSLLCLFSQSRNNNIAFREKPHKYANSYWFSECQGPETESLGSKGVLLATSVFCHDSAHSLIRKRSEPAVRVGAPPAEYGWEASRKKGCFGVRKGWGLRVVLPLSSGFSGDGT